MSKATFGSIEMENKNGLLVVNRESVQATIDALAQRRDQSAQQAQQLMAQANAASQQIKELQGLLGEPVADKPKRKRGRPPKTAQKETNGTA